MPICGCSTCGDEVSTVKPFPLKRGDTLRLNVAVTIVPDGQTTPVVVDVTGWTFWFTVKRYVQNFDDKSLFQAKTGDSTGGITIVDAVNGKLLAKMDPIYTRNLADGPETLYFDLQAKDTAGIVTTIDEGQILVTPDVTRAIS